ncbi:MAG TPA: hypothetical protein PLM41_13600 [Saprospiraceae bacterium]|nr:hypothetical protein [Saprospiraceae bacterium]
MSDFDDLFREKLDEEQSFPQRSKNWKMVSKRLDAFDAGGLGHHSYLKYWKIATIAAAVTVGVLAWKLVAVQQENTRLQQQVELVKSEVDSAKYEAGSAKSENSAKSEVDSAKSGDSAKSENSAKSEVDSAKSGNSAKYEVGSTKSGNTVKSERTESTSTVVTTREKSAPKPAAYQPSEQKVAGSNKQTVPARLEDNQVRPGVKDIPAPAVTPKIEKVVTAQPPVVQPETPTRQDSGAEPKDSAATVAGIAPEQEQTANAQTPEKQEVKENIPASPAAADSAAVKNPVVAPEKPVAAVAQSDTAALSQKPAEMIKKQRTYSNVRAGAHILGALAVPAEDGVSMLQGQGITAAWRFWKGFSLTAAADWMRFDVSTTKFIQRFHPHHNGPDQHGGGPGHEDMLVKVESTQRQRQLSLGLQYNLPLRFWVRPTVEVAHSWVRIDPYLITYKFEEEPHGPGGPMHEPEIRYQVEKTVLQRPDKVWRVGIGLQRETPRWIFNVGADYMKDFAASDAMFNAVTVKAGLQYKIF